VGVFLVLFYLVGGANALNLLDGMDGLAAGTTAIAAFFLAILAAGQGKTLVFVLALATLGAPLGFLPYNLNIKFRFRNFRITISNPHSSIFMGDAGSLFLGFILSCMAILFTLSSLMIWLASLPPWWLFLSPFWIQPWPSSVASPAGQIPLPETDSMSTISWRGRGWGIEGP
jgi:UDP-GlcNAc:undecaprenyl-phosphate GlcNAc-1-phosphate transferase